jgi:hypothetical protein
MRERTVAGFGLHCELLAIQCTLDIGPCGGSVRLHRHVAGEMSTHFDLGVVESPHDLRVTAVVRGVAALGVHREHGSGGALDDGPEYRFRVTGVLLGRPGRVRVAGGQSSSPPSRLRLTSGEVSRKTLRPIRSPCGVPVSADLGGQRQSRDG